jgi:hypothetical protein
MDDKLKSYIGDGVYVDVEGSDIVLTTENGICSTNEIYLDMGMLKSIIDYCKRKGILPDDRP